MTAAKEGVIKFAAAHRAGPIPSAALGHVPPLLAWRQLMFDLGAIGRDPARYDGAGYGNVSARVPPHGQGRGRRAFLISGTQTGGQATLAARDLCLVERYDHDKNRVESRGPARPSSESMTHGAVYDADPSARVVLHGHIPSVFAVAATLRLPETPPGVDYGTPEMAESVRRLMRDSTLPTRRVFVMRGHEDGVVAIGSTPEEAGTALVTTMAAALAVSRETAPRR